MCDHSDLFDFQYRDFGRSTFISYIVDVMAEAPEFLFYFLEEDKDEECQILLDQLKRNKPHQMYLARDTEGFQNILIQRHLLKDGLVTVFT